MSFETLKREIDLLDDRERMRLMAYLVAVQDSKLPGHAAELGRKISSNDPGTWLTLDELDKKLGLNTTVS